jgi:hypothetical protein
LSQTVRGTLPTQLSIACTVLFWSKLSRFVSALAWGLDDEGDLRSAFLSKAEDLIVLQNKVLKMSSSPINTKNHGYTRRLLMKGVRGLGNVTVGGFKYLAEEYKKYKENVTIDPFTIWDISADKVCVTCFIEDDAGKQDKIGSFDIDIDAPCSIMRTYLRKNFREKLNEICGDSFQFFGVIDDVETILDRDDEENTESRVYILLKIDDISELRTYSVLLMRDKAAELVHIPEFEEVEKEDSGKHEEEPVLNEKVSAHYI